MKTSQDLIRDIGADSRSESWNRFVRIYTPLISRWLKRFGVATSDIPDLTQEVLLAASTDLAKFEHNGRLGAFRTWLRMVALNRCRRYWQGNKLVSLEQIDSLNAQLDKLTDPHSELTQKWDDEHDAFVLRGLFEAMEREFDEQTLQVFYRLTIHEEAPIDVARRLGWPIGKIYTAKFQVMQRLRKYSAKYLD